jgi:tRNA A-37 threonylcarbamoyl transferase component Bud32
MTPVITKMIRSPNLFSKFSPSLIISKSPAMAKRPSNFLNNISNKTTNDSKNLLMRYASVKQTTNEDDIEEGVMIKNIPTIRKKGNNLKSLENEVKKNKDDYDLMPAFRQEIKAEKVSIICDVNNEDADSDEDELKGEFNYEGYLYKITNNKKFKKLWFKLLRKDFYYYKYREDKDHKGMHNLTGVFVREEPTMVHEGVTYYSFSVIYPKKVRIYYCDNLKEYKEWIKRIQKVTGYFDLNEIYDVRDNIGNGRFGLVKLGFHKQSGRKVAVKIMNKKEMSVQDLDLVRTEIEILKICQHPNIIQLYDVYENVDFIYISKFVTNVVMEHCSGGDLFSYIEKRGFRLSESKAGEIIFRLSSAIYYIHTYGVVHRDLKPENILMTEATDNADIRLLDFGLSKIIGPGQTCTEPYGTLVSNYVIVVIRCTRGIN